MSAKHNDLVNEIRLYLSSIGGLPVKIDTPGLLFDVNGNRVKLGTKGVLDIITCLKGRFVAIDAKCGRDRLKKEQSNFCTAVERAGGIAFAAYSVADVETRLKAEGLA
ncbi:hypothetical protein UFOVP407_43 [uncultured Caudovirales phage]|uniref:VRR-NUC domain containing protein n=1 Tax=uncultured Caudovirales phage TaxID=2100421 RepID=A0A6J5M231_9CAUD|nr:hypothetical protein UFOVP407_43 [uncultured Caudovirales phage]